MSNVININRNPSIYDHTTPQQLELIKLGRKMMDYAIPCKDDVKSNNLSKVGDKLVSVGSTFGVKVTDFSKDDIALINECYIMFLKDQS